MALYFAYGSNLLAARLGARCPSARRLGMAVAEGFDIAFDKIGQDGSGKATLVPAPGALMPSALVPGAIFELDDSELAQLDQIEGLGQGYDRRLLTLGHGAGGVEAFAYIAPPEFRDPDLPPFDWYLALVLAGAHECGLPADWIARLAGQVAMADPDLQRPRRLEALALLASCPPEWRLV